MTLFGARRSRRALEALAAVSALVLVASAVNLGRTLVAGADTGPSPVPNPDLVGRCGADVVLVAEDTLPAGLAAEAARALASEAVGTGGAVAVVSAAATPAELGPGFVEATPEALAPGGPLDQALAELASRGGSVDGRHRAAGLAQALDTALGAGEAPVLVAYLVDGPAPDGGEAAAAAAELRARPGTHLLFVAIGEGAGAADELAALAGPDVVAHGARALDVARDDVLLVAEPAALPAAAAEVGAGLCATRVVVEALDASAAPPAARPGHTLGLEVVAGAAPVGPITPPAPQATDAAGFAAWQVAMAPGATTTLAVVDTAGAPSGTRSLTCVGADGLVTTGGAERMVLDGVPAGADITCQVRLLDEAEPLRLRLVPLPGDVACPDDLAGLRSITAAPLGSQVTYCVELVNEGRRTAVGVRLDVPGLDPADGALVMQTELPPTGRTVRRYVTTLEGPAPVGAVATAEGVPAGEAAAFVGVVPPALSVEFLPAGDPRCGEPQETPRGCYRATNTGGSYLDQLQLVPTLTGTPLGSERRIAPGEAITIEPPADQAHLRAAAVDPTAPSPLADVVGTARAVDALGAPLPGADPVTSAVPAGTVLVEPLVSADTVAKGGVVDLGVAVSNPVGGPSLYDVAMTDSACTEPATSSELFGNGDAALDGGETWLLSCSASVDVEVLSVASFSATFAQDDTTSTTTEQTVPRERPITPTSPDLQIKKSQVNDLVPGSNTTYELKVQNTGNFAATNVTVTDPLPAGLTFVSASSDVGSCTAAGQVVTCSLGTLAPQESTEHVIVRIVVQASPAVSGQVVRNEASVSANEGDVYPLDNTSFVRARGGVCQRDCTPVSDPVSEGGGGGGGSGGGGSDDGGVSVGGERLVRTGVDSVAASAWAFVLLASGLSLVATARRRWALLAAG